MVVIHTQPKIHKRGIFEVSGFDKIISVYVNVPDVMTKLARCIVSALVEWLMHTIK